MLLRWLEGRAGDLSGGIAVMGGILGSGGKMRAVDWRGVRGGKPCFSCKERNWPETFLRVARSTVYLGVLFVFGIISESGISVSSAEEFNLCAFVPQVFLPGKVQTTQPDQMIKYFNEMRGRRPTYMVTGRIEDSIFSHAFPGERGYFTLAFDKPKLSKDGGQYIDSARFFMLNETKPFLDEKTKNPTVEKITMPVTCDKNCRILGFRHGVHLPNWNDAVHYYYFGDLRNTNPGSVIRKTTLCYPNRMVDGKQEKGPVIVLNIDVPPNFYNPYGSVPPGLLWASRRKTGTSGGVLFNLPVVRPPGTTYPLTLVPPGPPIGRPTPGGTLVKGVAGRLGSGLASILATSISQQYLQTRAENGDVGAQEILQSMDLHGRIIGNMRNGLNPDGSKPSGFWDRLWNGLGVASELAN